jgi:DNA-binding NarL/FixJ family response regulator
MEATGVWRGLFCGKWSLIDQFDHGGRRFMIARANEPRVGGTQVLSKRERQVVSALALGHTNKEIAYELGLANSTVAEHLRRAALKYGVSTRVELIGAFMKSQMDRDRDES